MPLQAKTKQDNYMTKYPTFTIRQLLQDYWFNFIKSNLNFHIHPVVFKEVSKIISCGDFSQGHALYQCSHYGSVLHVPFRCKNHFCNTCDMQYVNDRTLLNILFQAVSQTLLSWFASQNKKNVLLLVLSLLYILSVVILNGILISIPLSLKELLVILLFESISNIFLTLCFVAAFKLLCLTLWKKHKFSHLLFKILPQSKRLFHECYVHWRERILLSFSYLLLVPEFIVHS